MTVRSEMFRVLKPGTQVMLAQNISCHHILIGIILSMLHCIKNIFQPLAATQSMYPADVCAALERAGFKITSI